MIETDSDAAAFGRTADEDEEDVVVEEGGEPDGC